MQGGAFLPILAPQDEWIPLKQAVHYAQKSDKTLRGWCSQFGISRQSSRWAPIEVCLPALVMVMCGDMIGLELLRAGERSHLRVRRVLDYLGFDP